MGPSNVPLIQNEAGNSALQDLIDWSTNPRRSLDRIYAIFMANYVNDLASDSILSYIFT